MRRALSSSPRAAARQRAASLLASVLGGLLLAAPVAAREPEGAEAPAWTVERRVPLPRSGAPLDLAQLAGPGEDPVRVALVGSYSFLLDGSEIDAMSRTVSGRRDVAAGPFVVLPRGARVVASDPVAHRYELEVPRAPSMPLALNVMRLSTRHLIPASEARAQLTGVMHVEHLVPPPPPPTAAEAAVRTATEGASSVPVTAWAGGASGALALVGLALVWARRRREPVEACLRRARRARRAIAREVLAVGPAYDPVSASADRLHEAAEQTAAHHRSIRAALRRTASMASARRAELEAKRDAALARLEGLARRLEDTATQLAGRAADAARADGVERLVATLGADLDAAVEAEEELAAG
ncbi:MAG TPA: hypothetical protein RMH99_14085 [Sandaracinaceae bacterium LLY-WYZ-13_1]|nr:hypothetical protein [Sandaracinaceae bacterium LLY-WYZ-13_1]